jgi:hypothetical protein
VFIWYIISGFGIMYQEKSGIPGGGGKFFENFQLLDETFRTASISKQIFDTFLFCIILAGTDVMIFKIFSPKNSAKKWRF